MLQTFEVRTLSNSNSNFVTSLVMAIIWPYFAEFGTFRGQLRKSGRFSPEKCHKVLQLSTTHALCSSR